MNEAIEQYVQDSYTPILQEVIEDIFSLFERLNINTHEGYIINQIAEQDNIDPAQLNSAILSYLEDFLINLENEFGFSLADTITLEQRCAFIRGYVDLEDYIDHEAIIRILETDGLPADKIAQAVSLTTSIPSITLISYVLRVDEDAVTTLQNIHLSESKGEDLDQEMDIAPATKEQVIQVKAFNIFIDQEFHTKPECLELIRKGYEIGFPFKVYFDVVKDKLLVADETTQVVETITLLLLSQEYWQNPLLGWDQVTKDWYDSLEIVNKVSGSVKAILRRFDLFKTENKI